MLKKKINLVKMISVIIVLLLLFANWILCSFLVFIPIDFLNYLGSLKWLLIGGVILIIFSWCLGED